MIKKKDVYLSADEKRRAELLNLQKQRAKRNKKRSSLSLLFKRKKEVRDLEDEINKAFLNYIVPTDVVFKTDHFIFGDEYRMIWAIRHYPEERKELALLRYIANIENVHLKIKTKLLTRSEEDRVIRDDDSSNAQSFNTVDAKSKIEAISDSESLSKTITEMYRNKQKLVDCLVLIEMRAASLEKLSKISDEVLRELNALKINVDRLYTRQQDAFKAIMLAPNDTNSYKAMDKFYKTLPQESIGNLYPFAYSGKTDVNGFSLGKDVSGGNIIVDLMKRDFDKTNSNISILGDSGMGKSYLLKGILCNILAAGYSVMSLDPEHELEDLCLNLGGCYMNMLSGDCYINPLEPRAWADQSLDEESDNFKEAFIASGTLNQHLAWLKDWFMMATDINSKGVAIIEIFLKGLYERIGISEGADLSIYKHEDYPILSDLYDVIEDEWQNETDYSSKLYTKEDLRDILLAINSISKGVEAKYYNHHTTVKSDRFLVFGVDELLDTNQKLKEGMFFLILSYMSNELLRKGYTFLSIDELYLLLNSKVIIEYIRNFMKRIRKREGGVLIASQNIDDLNLPEVREMTKPLLAIPTHQFFFYPGDIKVSEFKDMVHMSDNEYRLISRPQRGRCLYRCGSERYFLKVEFPAWKSNLFGSKGGR